MPGNGGDGLMQPGVIHYHWTELIAANNNYALVLEPWNDLGLLTSRVGAPRRSYLPSVTMGIGPGLVAMEWRAACRMPQCRAGGCCVGLNVTHQHIAITHGPTHFA
jgi:hypothetical protein